MRKQLTFCFIICASIFVCGCNGSERSIEDSSLQEKKDTAISENTDVSEELGKIDSDSDQVIEEEVISEFCPEEGLYDRTYLVNENGIYTYRMNDEDIVDEYDVLYKDAFQLVIDSYNDVMHWQNQSYDFSKKSTFSNLVYTDAKTNDFITVGSYFEMDYNFNLDNVGYTYVDLDSDEKFELIFGVLSDAEADWIPEDYFERAFALVNNKPVHFVEGGSRCLFWLGSDGFIYETGSGGAAYSGSWKYHFDISKLQVSDDGVWGSEGLISDEFLGYWERPVYINEPFEDMDSIANDEKYSITEENLENLNSEWESRHVKIDWLRLSDYINHYSLSGL